MELLIGRLGLILFTLSLLDLFDDSVAEVVRRVNISILIVT